ncbi:hypothetical protein PIB30_075214, partial [Stylosanthes scabra]|nr:hypothetical protein [Stylosanthes scabra]
LAKKLISAPFDRFRLYILSLALLLCFAFQSDELLLDDEEFGLEGGNQQPPRCDLHFPSPPPLLASGSPNLPLQIPRSSSPSTTPSATPISPTPATSLLASRLGVTAARIPIFFEGLLGVEEGDGELVKPVEKSC